MEQKQPPKLGRAELQLLLDGLKANIGQMMEVFGFRHLNYTQKQLEAIEDKIEHEYPVGHKPQVTTLFVFGFFLGECIIRNIPGSKWKIEDDATTPFDIIVEVPGGEGEPCAQVSPFIRARKFWFDRSDRLSTMLRMVCRMNELNIDPIHYQKRADKDGWIQTFYGDRFRQVEADDEMMAAVKGMSGPDAIAALRRMQKEKDDGNK